jgi:hypothetical protein
MHRFNNIELTEQSMQSARQYFADNALACIEEVKNGSIVLPSHTSNESYFTWCMQRHDDFLAGKNDHTFTFLQYAYFLQTGECIALLPK